MTSRPPSTAAGERSALVLWPGVQFLTGQRFRHVRASRVRRHRRRGCVVGFDLAHAIGNLPLSLEADDADFAVWCSYKYLNAGPGAVGGAFVHPRHSGRDAAPRLAGWWGHDTATRFRMRADFVAAPGAAGWAVSNPPILSMAPLVASLEDLRRSRHHGAATAKSVELLPMRRPRLPVARSGWATSSTSRRRSRARLAAVAAFRVAGAAVRRPPSLFQLH